MVTDATMVSAAGLLDASGEPVAELVAAFGDRLPPVLAPDAVAGALVRRRRRRPRGSPPACRWWWAPATGPARSSAPPPRPDRPMVSWGTTANVSVPVADFPDPLPDGLVVTRAASGGWLLEGGLSAAGSLVAWLSRLTGIDADALMARAAGSPRRRPRCGRPALVRRRPGPVVAAPGAGGGFVGLSFDHDPGDLARAVVESVAWDVLRCLRAMGSAVPAPARVPGRPPRLVLTGAGGPRRLGPRSSRAVTGLPAVRRRSGEAASAGAALLTARCHRGRLRPRPSRPGGGHGRCPTRRP